MAENDSAVGAILEIPTGAIRNIERAEKAIWALHDASLKAANQVYGDFSKRMPMGVDVFIKKLKEAKEAMEDVGTVNVNLNVNGVKSQMDSAVNTVRAGANDISETLQRAGQLGWEGLNKNRRPAFLDNLNLELSSIKEVENALKSLKKTRDILQDKQTLAHRYTTLTNEQRSSGEFTFNRQQYSDVIGYLEEIVALWKKTESAKNKALSNIQQKQQDKTDKTYLDEQERLLGRILQLRKDIAEVNISVKKGQILGGDVSKDEAQLERLRKELENVGLEYRKLREGKGDISDTAQTKAEVAAQKFYTESIKETRREREKLNEAITRGDERTAQGQQGRTVLGSGEDLAIQRQLNADYKRMLKIIKEQGELKAKVASEGRRMTQDEINLIGALAQRYKVYYDDVNRIAGAYKNMSAAAARNFQADKSEQLARNAILLADAQAKAAQAVEKTNNALHDISPVMQAYNAINAQIERENKLLQQAGENVRKANAQLNEFWTKRPDFNVGDAEKKLQELQNKITEIKNKAAGQGSTKASITLSALPALQKQYDELEAPLKKLRQLEQELTNASNANMSAYSRYTPRLAAMREEADRLSKEIERLVSANHAFNNELGKGNNVKSLTAEYKNLIATIEKLGAQMTAFRQAGGDTNSASYQTMNAQLQAMVAREKEIRMMSINEVEQYRQQRAQAAYQADISAFIQAEAAKTAESKKQAEIRAKQQAENQNKYLNSAQGAMWYSRQINKGKVDNSYENRERAIKQLENAIKSLDSNDKNYDKTLKQLTATLTRLKNAQSEVTAAMKPSKPMISPQDAINAAKNASTLKGLQAAYKQLKTVMDETDPDSDEWKEMNAVYSDTKKRIDAIRTSMGELHTQSQRTNGMMGQLQNRIAAAFSVQAITGFIKKLIQTRAEFELQNVSLRAILQNKEEADKIFAQVQQMAMQSPFTIMQLNTYTKQLAAYRIESERLLDTTKMLADVSAGLGVDMQRLILAYGQVKSANYLRATEVRQFTEAGLNIAGELAQYFSELQGKMITVGDVMEMITKRMVRFEDVEEVFKRVTGAGGIFYDMQKKQSETLMGQMQRIQDAYAIMMNEIGQSNQGVISTILKMIRGLIQNWEVVVNLLYGAGAAMGVYAIKTTAAAIAQGAFNASSKGLVGVLAKVKDSLKDMLESLKANPYTLLIGAAVAAGAALYDLIKKSNEVKASYDKIIVGLSESSRKLDGIAAKIESAQEKIESTKEEMSGLTKGTAEYTAAADANKEAVTEQYRALQELRNKFPEVYAEITKTADGTRDMTEAIREFNKITTGAQIITTRIKGREGEFEDDFKTDFEELSEAQNKYNAQFAVTKANFNTLMAQAEALYNTRKAEGTLTEKEAEIYQKLLSIREETLSTEEKMNKAYEQINKPYIYLGQLSEYARNYKKEYYSLFRNFGYELSQKIVEAGNEANAVMNDILIQAGVTSTEAFKGLPPETQKSAKEAGELAIKEIGLALDEVQLEVIRRKIEIPLGIKFDFSNAVEQHLSDMQEAINKYIDEHPDVGLAKIVNAETEPDDFFKTVAQGEKQNLADAEKYSKAKARWNKKLTNEQLANNEKVQAAARKTMLEYFGYSGSGGGGTGKDTVLELWKNRLKAVQDFYKRYEELQNNYSDTESLKRAQSAFAKLFKTLKIDMGEVVGRDMGKKGLADNINAMLEQVRKVRPQLADEFEKAFADVTVQIDVEIQKEALDRIKNDMQEVADNFELTETFRKMGVTTDLVFMLGGKPTTLKDYRKTLEDTYKQTYLIEEQYGKEGVKAYEEVLKKIKQLEQKNAIERAKNYVKYLTESVGERAQIEIKAMREIEAIRSDDTLDDFSKEQAVLQRRKKMMEDLAKVDMENLKSSDVYVSVFKDLENASKEQLQFVINKLRELQSTFKDLSPAQVRSLANDMKKLENAVADKESFKKLGSTLKEVVEFQRNRNRLLEQQATLQGQLFDAKSRESSIQVALTDAQIKLNSIQDKSSKEYKEQEKIVRDLQMRLLVIQSVVEKTGKDLKENTDDINDGDEATKRLEKTWGKIVKILNSTSSLIGDISEGLSNMGLLTDGLADAFESAQSVIGNVVQAGSGAIQAFTDPSPIGKLQGAFKALGGVVKLVGSLFAIGDKKKERQIKKLQEKVEDLDKAYENLHDAMEEAYQFDDYNAGFKASMKNLDEQAKAYDEMIRLEEAKKKTDKNKVKEYKEAREEIEKAREELREARYEEYGSISKKSYQDEAEAFVSAWLDAYKETDDGLDALTEHWDEFFENLVMKQAASSVVSKRMAKYIDEINAAIESGDTGLSLSQTFAEIGERLKSELGIWNEDLKAFFDALGFKGGAGEFVLSDLQKGIQNITEPQAAAIEAYLNSMRFAVFRHTEQLDILIATIQMQYGTGADNPIVGELKGIRGVLDNIYSTLRGVIENKTGRGACLRIV